MARPWDFASMRCAMPHKGKEKALDSRQTAEGVRKTRGANNRSAQHADSVIITQIAPNVKAQHKEGNTMTINQIKALEAEREALLTLAETVDECIIAIRERAVAENLEAFMLAAQLAAYCGVDILPDGVPTLCALTEARDEVSLAVLNLDCELPDDLLPDSVKPWRECRVLA